MGKKVEITIMGDTGLGFKVLEKMEKKMEIIIRCSTGLGSEVME